MGQVHVRATLTNYREAIRIHLGQLSVDQVHHYATETLVDSVTVLERLALMVDGHRQQLVLHEGTWDQPVFRV